MSEYHASQVGYAGYLDAEDHNLVKNFIRLQQLPDLIAAYDDIYLRPIRRVSIKQDDRANRAILTLYRFVHERFYVTMSNYLRNHFSDAFASTRQAIDATFTAYHMLYYPTSVAEYEEGSKFFENIKANISRNLSGPPPEKCSKWPHRNEIKHLLDFHEYCSQFGSHSDPATVYLKRRLQRTNPERGGREDVFSYFQIEEKDKTFIFYFIHFVGRYFYMFEALSSFWERNLIVYDPEWLTMRKRLAATLDALNNEYRDPIHT
jgi:hypothetical protein